MKLIFKQLSAKTWEDFTNLFGNSGACGGCWCMWWRLKYSDYKKNQGLGNKKLMHKLVLKNETIGILAYYKKEAIGWCSISPREKFIRLNNSRILKPVDDKKVWSINCFFIKKDFRNKSISNQLILQAIKLVKKNNGKIVESYPIETKKNNYPQIFAYTGFAQTFYKNGFNEVARRSKTRPILRREI